METKKRPVEEGKNEEAAQEIDGGHMSLVKHFGIKPKRKRTYLLNLRGSVT